MQIVIDTSMKCRPQYLFYSLVRFKPDADFTVVLPKFRNFTQLDNFATGFEWVTDEPDSAQPAFAVPGNVLPFEDAIAFALKNPGVYSVYKAGVLVHESLDKFGTNFTPAMLDDCTELDYFELRTGDERRTDKLFVSYPVNLPVRRGPIECT